MTLTLLKKIDVEIRDPKSSDDDYKTVTRNVIADLFPDATHLVASWYSGALVIPRGQRVAYVHMGYGSMYERYTLLTVKAGRITKRLDLGLKDFESYKRSQFEAFKRTAEYAAKVAEINSKDSFFTDKLAEDFLFDFEAEHYLSEDFGSP